MYSLLSAEIRHLEDLAWQQAGIPSPELMEKAGHAALQGLQAGGTSIIRICNF